MKQALCVLAVLCMLAGAGPAAAAEPAGNLLLFLKGLDVAGGISAGEFSLANSGPGAADNTFLLSNVLLEVSNEKQNLPVGFTIAAGETSTPSLLGAPENANDLDVEYAYLTLRPRAGTAIEAGLLQPDSGYESTYTYANPNIILGAVASQQPYNAYGARIRQEFGPFSLSVAYFGERLDDTEYAVGDGSTPDRAWEVTLGGTLAACDYTLYHYHIAAERSMTGVVVEHQTDNLLVAVNLDYWRWAQGMASQVGRRYAIGGAFYLVPHFGRFSLPLRLEYIDQGTSGIYLDAPAAKNITTATLTPTYTLTEKAYLRAEVAYVHARDGFAKKDGTVKDGRLALAAEVGYRF
jgi:hypothetical protein